MNNTSNSTSEAETADSPSPAPRKPMSLLGQAKMACVLIVMCSLFAPSFGTLLFLGMINPESVESSFGKFSSVALMLSFLLLTLAFTFGIIWNVCEFKILMARAIREETRYTVTFSTTLEIIDVLGSHPTFNPSDQQPAG